MMYSEDDGGAGGKILANRYRLGSKLGQGGMGAVWQAYDEVLQRQVAIKQIIFPRGMAAEACSELCARMMREARAAARLSHPGIITIHDVFEQDAVPWVVMQLVEALDLGTQLQAKGPMTVLETAELGLQVLDALSEAHGAGVCHRDIKPGNILMTQRGPVLVDFGIATLQGATGLTQSGALVGTPQYMAPELLAGGRATPASDLWALGVTLYVALEGASPFHRDSLPAVVAAVLHYPPRSSQAAGSLTPVLEGLLHKDPNARLDASATASLLAGVIREQEAALEISAPSTVTSEQRKKKRYWKPLIAALLVADIVVAGKIVGIYSSAVPWSELEPTQEATSSPSASVASSAPSPSPSSSSAASASSSSPSLAPKQYPGSSLTFTIPANWSVKERQGDNLRMVTEDSPSATISITALEPPKGLEAGQIGAIAKHLQSIESGDSGYVLDYGPKDIGGTYIHAVEWGSHKKSPDNASYMVWWQRTALVMCAGRYNGSSWAGNMFKCQKYFRVRYSSYESQMGSSYSANYEEFLSIVNSMHSV